MKRRSARLATLVRLYARQPGQRGAAFWSAFVTWFNRLELSENAILLAFAVAIGAASALGVVAFYGLIDLAFTALYRWPGEYLPRLSFLA